MNNRNVRTRWVSRRQLDVLWDFLTIHRDIATAYNRSLRAKEYAKRKWREIAEILNAQGDGAHKEWNEWSKYWVDYKAKLKKRVSALRSALSATGGGPSTEQALTEIESKFLQLLGEDFGQGLPGIRVEPFPENTRSTTTTADDPQASEIILMSDQINSLPTQDAFLQEPQEEVPLQHSGAEPTANSPSQSVATTPPPAPAPAPTVRSPRRRRHRREPPMSQEAARRALVESSKLRAEASVRSSNALEGIHNTLQRIERFINGVFPRAGE